MRSVEDSRGDKEPNGKGTVWEALRREGTIMGGIPGGRTFRERGGTTQRRMRDNEPGKITGNGRTRAY
jgi:hypothetical protein